jgi:uncharacterized protein (DUF305 family)
MSTPHCARIVAALLLPLLVVAGCATEQQAASPESGDFSGSDVSYLQLMVTHHRDGIYLAGLVPERSDRAELAEFAGDVRTTYEAEIGELTGLLGRAGAEAPEDDGEHDHSGIAGDSADTPTLEDLRGEEFDIAFLDAMTAHHQAAIRDSQRAIDRVEHPDVRALAERVLADHEAEVDQLDRWRDEWELPQPPADD